jgi:hypothetical protein
MTGLHQRVYTIVGLLVSVALLSVPANAAGVTRVQQSDGSVQVYQNVTMSLNGQTLRVRSRDRKGELEVSSDACSALGAVQRCLPYSTVLRQHGQAHTIALERGTVFSILAAIRRRCGIPRADWVLTRCSCCCIRCAGRSCRSKARWTR